MPTATSRRIGVTAPSCAHEMCAEAKRLSREVADTLERVFRAARPRIPTDDEYQPVRDAKAAYLRHLHGEG